MADIERYIVEREIFSKNGSSITDVNNIMKLSENQEYKDYVNANYLQKDKIVAFGLDSTKDDTGNIKKINSAITFTSRLAAEEFENDPVIKSFREAAGSLRGNGDYIANKKSRTVIQSV